MNLSPLSIICALTFLRTFRLYDITIYATGSVDLQKYFSSREPFTLNLSNSSDSNFYTGFLLILLLTTDRSRYRSIIILSSIVTVIAYVLFFFIAYDIVILAEFAFEAFIQSATLASDAYLYAKIQDKSQYPKITAYVRISAILGAFSSKCWAQFYAYILRPQMKIIPMLTNSIVLCSALVCSFLLPSVDSTTSNNIRDVTEEVELASNGNSETNKLNKPNNDNLWYNFKTAYTNINVLKWSIWYLYAAFLIAREDDSQLDWYQYSMGYYPLTYVAYIILSVALLIIFSNKPTKWEMKGDWILSLVSFTLALLITLQYFYLSRLFYSSNFRLACLVAELFLTIATWEIIKIIPKNSYALVIGFNTFLAHILHRLVSRYFLPTLVLYSVIFFILGVLYGIFEIHSRIRHNANEQETRTRNESMGHNEDYIINIG